MNRKEFISGLRKELSKLPKEEIEAAVEYYEEYFDEAGKENEQQVIDGLGGCKKVANQIKSEYAVRLFDEEEKPTVKKGISAIWYVIIGICSAPVAIPAAIALGILAITIFVAVAGCVVALFFSIFGCFVAAGALVVLGVASVKATLSTGLMFIGTGLAAMGFIAGILVLLFIGVKALIKLIIRAAGKAHRRKKVEKMLAASRWKRVDDENGDGGQERKEDSDIGGRDETGDGWTGDDAAGGATGDDADGGTTGDGSRGADVSGETEIAAADGGDPAEVAKPDGGEINE